MVTRAMIESYMHQLESRMGCKLVLDINIGGYQLCRVMNAGYGEHPINYYRMNKTEFYHMLLAMNEALIQKADFEKDIKQNFQDDQSCFVADLLKSKDKIYYHSNRDQIIDSLKNQLLNTNFASYLYQWSGDPFKRVLKNVYGCASQHAYDTDPVYKLLGE